MEVLATHRADSGKQAAESEVSASILMQWEAATCFLTVFLPGYMGKS